MAYIGNWVQSSCYSTLRYFLFEENGDEITRKMRLSCSNRDWFGTQQTLVLDKVWLRELTEKFDMILEVLKKEPNIKCESNATMKDSTWREISTIEPTISVIISKLVDLKQLLGEIFLLYTNPEMSDIFKYFFSCKRNGLSRKTSESFKSNSQFYADLKKLIPEGKITLQKLLDEIFTEDNCRKIQEMGIMFGLYPAIIENN